MSKPWEQDWSEDSGAESTDEGAKPWEMGLETDGTSPPPKKRSFVGDIAEFGLDMGKRAAGAVVSGVASIPLGVEKGAKSLVRQSVEASSDAMMPAGIYNPGIDTDETIHGQETARDKDARFLAAERAASGIPNIPGARSLAQAGREGREAIHATTSEATQRAVADSQVTGNLLKGQIDFGKDPSARGYVMQASDVFGSMLPVVVGSLVTRNANVGGVIGGSMAAGEGAESAAAFVAEKSDDALMAESPFFARLVNGGASFEEARRLTVDKASESAALLQGVVASVGDRFTGKLVTGKLDPLLTRAAGKSVLGKTAAGGALSAAEEGTQELAEGVAADIGMASAVPTKEIGEDSAANFVLGAMGGAPAGAGRGAYSGIRDRFEGDQGVKDPAPGTPGQQTTAQAPASNPVPAAQPEAAIPAAGGSATGAQAAGVATSNTEQADQALREPLPLTALDRANELDAERARIGERLAEITPENGYGPMFDTERAELQQQAQAAQAERDAIAQTWPTTVQGAPASFSTEAGVKLDGQYALIDADDLVTSHDESLRPNPLFPVELQPRDRSRQASEMQVSGIVQRLDPARLGVSADAATGAPIVGADGLVESGNARTIALKRIYQANGQKAEDYKAWLKQSSAQFGLTPEALDGMRRPVLVRVRSTPVNRAEFARQANQSTIQRMSPSEQANSDAKRLTSLEGLNPDEAGEFSTSHDFIRQFMAGLPITEQSDMIESDGRLSTTGYRRIQNAVLAKAYGDSPTLRRMTESLDNNLLNIGKALVRAAPSIAQARERMQAGVLNDADIAPDLVQAVEGLSALKEKGWTVAQELGQGDLTGPKYSPEAAELLQFLSDNIRSPRRIAEFLQRYHEALEAAGDPNQSSMFDDNVAPTRAELLNTARGTTDGQLNEQGAGEPAGQNRQEPQDAPGDQGRAQGDEGRKTDDDTGQPGTDEGQASEVARDQAPGPEPAKKPAPRTADRDFWSYAKEQGHAPKDVKIGTDLHTRLKTEFEALKAGKARLKAITGKKLSDEWTAFSKASDALGVPRADMPQIKAEHRGALTQFLAARDVTHESDADVSALDLKPTQAEFSPEKVKQAQEFDGGDRSILVSADGYVLDGHHQWLAKLAQGLPIRAIRFDAPMAELLPLAREFPSADVAPGAAPEEKQAATLDAAGFDPVSAPASATALTQPTEADVVAQQDSFAMAAEKEARAQVKRESEAGAEQFELEREEGRQDTTGDIFEQQVQTQTEAFSKWFGDSKVVDSAGNPMVMYHGTSKNEQGEAFTMFDAYASNYGLFGQGAYFTDDASVASEYTSKGKGSSPTVYSAYMSIKKPIDMDADADLQAWANAYPDLDLDAYHEGGTTNESYYRAAEEALRDEGMEKWEGAEAMQNGLRKMGHDGITHVGGGRVRSEGKKHRVFIAFDPEQIKSATGNRGTFDPRSPDIRLSLAADPVGGSVGTLNAIAKTDDLFSLPKSDADTIEQIAADNDSEIKVRKASLPGNETMYTLTMPDGTRAMITVRQSGPNSVYGAEVDADNNTTWYTGRPGENPEAVPDGTEDVWIDVSNLKPGQNGARVYNIAANFAHNTGRIFIGDPAGLSDAAMRRRAEHMLSSALKFGTTKHLAPHPRQTDGATGLGVPALKWVYGDDIGNIERLIEINIKALDSAFPEAAQITYDTESGTFSTPDEERINSARLKVVVSGGPIADRRGAGRRAAFAGAGWRTLARGAVFRALLRGRGAQGDGAGRPRAGEGILDRLVRQRAQLASTAENERVFYSRGLNAAGDLPGRIPFAELQALADRLKAGMPNMPKVSVFADPSQAPLALREYIIRQDAWYDVEGAMHDGELYLFASGLTDAARAEHVLLEHEAAHYGLRAILGSSLKPAMRLVHSQNANVRRAAAELQKRGKLSDVVATEEVIVDIPTAELAQLKGWRKVVVQARDWLADRGYKALAQKLTDWLSGTLTQQQRADLFVAELVRAARDHMVGKIPARAAVGPGTRLSGTLAEDIAKQEAWLQAEARSRGFKDIEDLLERDYPVFEKLAELWREKNPAEMLLSRAPSSRVQENGRKTAAERADDIIQKPAGGFSPLDRITKLATRVTGVERLTGAIYNKAGDLLDRLVPEKVKAGIVSDYGVPEAVIDQRIMLQGRQRVQLRKVGSLVEKLSTLTREESRVAYEWMNMDGADPRAYVSMMQGLPEESVAVLQDVQKMIDDLSKEAVRMGQLPKEAFERNRFAYLRRSYAKHILEQTTGEKAKRSRVISILGDQYKGRGLVQAEPMARMQAAAPDWWGRKMAAGKADTALKGQKFIRLEKRAAPGGGSPALPGMAPAAPGKVQRVVYWPADQAITGEHAGWTRADTWEVRDVKGGNIVLWRDFTKDEREQMGEVDEARFAIAKTLHGMVHDVEVGRYLEWLARNYSRAEGQTIPGVVVEASERYRDTFAPSEWVKVPDTQIPGTSTKKYGALAGHYLPGPIWNDLRQVVGGQFRPFGDTYAAILRMWKTSKTALSPSVHMNNVMSNFVMADWQDVGAAHVGKALRILLAASNKAGGITDREAATEITNRYKDSGGDIGSWATQEIARDQLDPLLSDLDLEMAATNGQAMDAQAGIYSALQHALGARFPAAWEALKAGKSGKAVAGAGGALIDLYQAEDDVFRLAAWLKSKEEGADDLAAGKKARRSFLDYNINAPWIQAMRASAWPFISFTYRAAPLLVEIAGKKPHKLMKLMMFAGGLNALGALLAGGGDDDEERKLLPEEKAGKIWGIVPKLIRMPWNDGHDSPVYLDIRRWVPVGDVFDMGQGNAAIPMLPGLMPGGPLVLAGEVVLNKSAFTGKAITLETDTPTEKAEKLGGYLYKAFAPNVLGLPGTYATEGVAGSMTGRTDAFGRELSTAQAMASSVGVKLGSYPADVLRRNIGAKAMAELSEIDKQISQLKRQYSTGRIDSDELREQAEAQNAKKIKLMQEVREKLQ